MLVVGAGGIGCELVKNLVLTGFEDITMIDLDTIDYSNLNRQFLFRAHHVNRSKAMVAREAVLEFPHDGKLEIKAEHGNIKEARFGPDFFSKVRPVRSCPPSRASSGSARSLRIGLGAIAGAPRSRLCRTLLSSILCSTLSTTWTRAATSIGSASPPGSP